MPGRIALSVAAILGGMFAVGAHAQTTDGYHQYQVFPVVVDTASFAQKFTFRNPTPIAFLLHPRFFPAVGTTATAIDCPVLALGAGQNVSSPSLRALCPGLPGGSQFGFLRVNASGGSSTVPAVFSGFSRVANPQGNGFAVEAFPANTFTSATSVVAGIRRLAASGGSPSFQTNCFVGNLNEDVPIGAPPTTPIHYTLAASGGSTIGSGDVNLLPGQIVRLLDVFSVAPAGDYNDATIRFEELGAEEPGILAFCTVQDNTSFGADFRVAKQELADGTRVGVPTLIGSQDMHASRETSMASDLPGRAFSLPPGTGVTNRHLFYFRHPDYVSCALEDAVSGAPLAPSANLEMQLEPGGGQVIAGGAGVTSFGAVYLGDKTDINSGFNGPYYLLVQDAGGTSPQVTRTYRVHCRSGSGHTRGEKAVLGH